MSTNRLDFDVEADVSRIEKGPANRKFPFESNIEPNNGVVVYMFNADCHVGVVYVL